MLKTKNDSILTPILDATRKLQEALEIGNLDRAFELSTELQAASDIVRNNIWKELNK